MLSRVAIHHALFYIACILTAVQGNTEIVNIYAVPSEISTPRQLPTNWSILSSSSRELTFALPPIPLDIAPQDLCNKEDTACPYDLWTVLDFDDPAWGRFSKFTLRVSLPANHPADCIIDLFSLSELPLATDSLPPSEDDGDDANLSTRLQYARIRLKDTGIRPPPFTHTRRAAVPFNVILEPLYFGVLPASVAPVLGVLLPVALLAWFVVAPRAHQLLSSVAQDIRKDMRTQHKSD